ncbi:MAG TPA: porin [Polyangia bacterium]
MTLVLLLASLGAAPAGAADKEPDAEAEPPKAQLEAKGRVFVLAHQLYRTARDIERNVDSEAFTLSVPSARAGIKAKVTERISLNLEADFSGGRPSIRDGYIQAKAKRWLVRAGRFKMPLSAFTLESPWTLPRADRGLMDDILSDHMLLSGRREGIRGRLEGGGFWDPSLSVGVFQSLESLTRVRDLTSVVRAAVEPGKTEIALVGQRRANLLGRPRAFWAGGLDVTSDERIGDIGLRTWVEGRLGESWFRQGPLLTAQEQADAPAKTFFEARLMTAARKGGALEGELYGEIFFSGGLLDPDTNIVQDHLLELSGGINVGQWLNTRLTLEVVHTRAGVNFPTAIFQELLLPTLARQTAALLQAGAAF